MLASADDGKVALVVNLDNSLAAPRRGGDRPRARAADRRRRRRPADAWRKQAARTSTASAMRWPRAATGSPPRSRDQDAGARLRLGAHRRGGLGPDGHRCPPSDDGRTRGDRRRFRQAPRRHRRRRAGTDRRRHAPDAAGRPRRAGSGDRGVRRSASRGAQPTPVETYDERFTSVLAGGDDARAAAHLLSSYLEWQSARS